MLDAGLVLNNTAMTPKEWLEIIQSAKKTVIIEDGN